MSILERALVLALVGGTTCGAAVCATPSPGMPRRSTSAARQGARGCPTSTSPLAASSEDRTG